MADPKLTSTVQAGDSVGSEYTVTAILALGGVAALPDGSINFQAFPSTQLNYVSIIGGSPTVVGVDGGTVAIFGGGPAGGDANGGDIILEAGLKAGGSGRDGQIIMDQLPTADPEVIGALWNDAGTLKISAGP